MRKESGPVFEIRKKKKKKKVDDPILLLFRRVDDLFGYRLREKKKQNVVLQNDFGEYRSRVWPIYIYIMDISKCDLSQRE